jgi:hypothetical protein
VSLFVAVLPVAPLAALINNFIEIRVDAFQTVVQTRRSDGEDARGIGTWLTMLKAVTLLSVITNSALLGACGTPICRFSFSFLTYQSQPPATRTNKPTKKPIKKNKKTTVFPGDSLESFLSNFGTAPTVTTAGKVWTFIIFEHVVLLLQAAVAVAVPDVPSRVSLEVAHEKLALAARVERELKADGLTFGEGEDDAAESDADGDGEDDDTALGIYEDDGWG